MANLIFFLYDFEVSSAIRMRSGAPFNPTVGVDLNGDAVNNERPLLDPGVTYHRNYFMTKGIFVADCDSFEGGGLFCTVPVSFEAAAVPR